ncbi:MAG: signal peptidase I [Acidobacteriota bacterium]
MSETPETSPPKEKNAPDAAKLPPELRKSLIREYFESAIVTVIMALFGMTFIVQAVKVPTGSMLNTILVGDHLLVNKFIFGKDGMMIDKIMPHRPIRRGDIIVFKYPRDPDTNYVKRVIGLPGETIEVKGTRVYVNGQELPEQRVIAEQHRTPTDIVDNDAPLDILNAEEPVEGASYKVYYSEGSEESDFDPVQKQLTGQEFAVGKPFTLPANEYFVMGDNRDNSQDSRYWGTVPRDNVVGRALMVYWSFDLSKDADGHVSSGNLIYDFFSRTRWSRMGTLIK